MVTQKTQEEKKITGRGHGVTQRMRLPRVAISGVPNLQGWDPLPEHAGDWKTGSAQRKSAASKCQREMACSMPLLSSL